MSRESADRRGDSRANSVSSAGNYKKQEGVDGSRPDSSQGNGAGGRRNSQPVRLRENCSVEEWIQMNAPSLLEDSLKRLTLDTQVIEKRNLDSFTKDHLLEEKRRVKNELKRYDSEFDRAYRRFPRREEKEPMRPLYIYYKRLKQAISRADHSHVPTQQAKTQKSAQPGFQDIQPMIHRLETLKTQRANLREKLEAY